MDNAVAAGVSPSLMPESRTDRWFLPVLLCIAALATYFRFSMLGHESLWLDELWSVRAATRESWAGLLQEVRFDVHPPLYFALLRLWIYVLGPSEAAIRSLSALAGVAAIAMVGFLGRRLASSFAGLAAAAFQATAPFAIAMDRETRANALMSLLSLVGLWLCSGEDLRGRRWLGYVLVAAALPYTHLFGIFAVLGHGLWVASESATPDGRRKLLQWVGAASVAALCFVPWLPSLRSQGDTFSAGIWYGLPERDALAWLLSDLAGGAGCAAMLVIGVVLVLADPGDGRLARLLAASVIALVLVPMAVSLAWTPMLRDRNVLALLPVLCLVAGAGYSRIRGAGVAWIAVVTASFALNHLRTRFWGPREEWREAAAFVRLEAQPGDGFDANHHWLWSYYLPQVEVAPDPAGRTWYLRAHDELTLPPAALEHGALVVEKRFAAAYVALVDGAMHEVAVGRDRGPPVWDDNVLHFYWTLRVRSEVLPTAGRCAIGVQGWGEAAGGIPAQLELGFVAADGASVVSTVALGPQPSLVWGQVSLIPGPSAIEINFANDGTATDDHGVTADRNAYVNRVLWRCDPI
jgi:4-amino-4-deoxy-L-arabinose transferase-like glycosyltransferase